MRERAFAIFTSIHKIVANNSRRYIDNTIEAITKGVKIINYGTKKINATWWLKISIASY